jgi:FAD/FMN-containing dehydrogenase
MEHRLVVLLALGSVRAAVTAAAELRRHLAPLEACELFLHEGLELVCRTGGLARPFGNETHSAYLLVEAASDEDPSAAVDSALSGLSGVEGVIGAADLSRQRALWRYREMHTEAINRIGVPHKLDLAVPIPELADFIDLVPSTVTSIDPVAHVWLFGHVADGNVHVNVTGLSYDDYRVDEAIFGLVAKFGGTISAEHGIGSAKRQWLHLSRSPNELAAFGAIKRALDPAMILNPNILLPAS